jgi:lipopolysaccharide transport system permease protein
MFPINPGARLSIPPLKIFQDIWLHRNLVMQMVRREVVGRYRGSVMGLLWSLLTPVFMLAVYTFFFSVVLKARWGGGDGGKTEFAMLLFAGMIVHGLFAECINRAPNLILSNPNYVKKVVFPLEILPWVALGSAFFHAGVSLFVLLAFLLAVQQTLHWTALLLPLVWLPYLLLILGLSWFLAALGVYLRDIQQTTGILTTVLMFLSPVFYPASALPEDYRLFLQLNPLTFIIEQTREVLIWGQTPNWLGLIGYSLASLITAWLGLIWFQKSRRGFADVL